MSHINISVKEQNKKRKSGDDFTDFENVNPEKKENVKTPSKLPGPVRMNLKQDSESLEKSPKRTRFGQINGQSPIAQAITTNDRTRTIQNIKSPVSSDLKTSFTPTKSAHNLFTSIFKGNPTPSPKISSRSNYPKTLHEGDIVLRATNTMSSGISQTNSSTTSSSLRHPTEVKRSSSVIVPDQISGLFDRAFSVSEDRVNDIISACLKPKNKWDFKDKSLKQTSVINDLKVLFATIFEETRALRTNCIGVEKSFKDVINSYQREIDEHLQSKSAIRSNETQLKKTIMRLTNEQTKVSSALALASKEKTALRAAITESEADRALLKERFAAEEALRLRAETDLGSLKNEISAIKREAAENEKSIVIQCDQRLELSVAGYRDEIASLRADLGRRQNENDRTSLAKADLDRLATESRENLLKTQADLRDAESTIFRYQQEVGRLTAENEQIKAQLIEKETDLRMSLVSVGELQRQSGEERTLLRSEVSSLQSRLALAELEKETTSATLLYLKEEAAQSTRDASAMRLTISNLQSQITALQASSINAKEAVLQLEVERELRAICELREAAERRERIAACAQLLATQTDCDLRMKGLQADMDRHVSTLNAQLLKLGDEKQVLEAECRRLGDLVTGLSSEALELKKALEHAERNHESAEMLGRMTGEVEVLRRHVKELNDSRQLLEGSAADRIQHLEEQLKAGEVMRRKMHNKIQELRGNVRVFARVRPFLPNDNQDSLEPAIAVNVDGVSLRISQLGENGLKPEAHSFSFDKVFGPSSSQESVFDEVSEFVQSALDGYNVCLFSYGQTGSGKTHTMQGSGVGPMRGIIPRAIQQVGIYKLEQEQKGWHYQMSVSYIEIYNETIRDLLRQTGGEDCKHEIKKDAAGNTYVSDIGMIEVDPNDSVAIDQLMEQAARLRSVAQTSMNEHSSRSHSVFTLYLKAINSEQGVQLRGSLSLVDLAGSERLDRSGATGDRLRETAAINKSLSALTDVFVAIANKQSHIPFRNSKLTYLLQPALSGDGKTLMLVNLSPTDDSFGESLCSLRFASQVNQCELGKPKRNVKEASSASINLVNSSVELNSISMSSIGQKSPMEKKKIPQQQRGNVKKM